MVALERGGKNGRVTAAPAEDANAVWALETGKFEERDGVTPSKGGTEEWGTVLPMKGGRVNVLSRKGTPEGLE